MKGKTIPTGKKKEALFVQVRKQNNNLNEPLYSPHCAFFIARVFVRECVCGALDSTSKKKKAARDKNQKSSDTL
jgi:hypothetical protein